MGATYTVSGVEVLMRKLIRDKIPELMRSRGYEPNIHEAPVAQRWNLLRTKLAEEATELLAADGWEAMLEELADVVEVVEALKQEASRRCNKRDVEWIREEKARLKGRFDKFLVWKGP